MRILLFPCDKLPTTNQFLRSVLTPTIKNITEKIYQYCPIHCANCGPQVKGIDFEQYFPPVLSAPTLHLIVAISAAYRLTIVIADVTNNFRSTLTAYYEPKMIDCPTHYISWFKLRFPAIEI